MLSVSVKDFGDKLTIQGKISVTGFALGSVYNILVNILQLTVRGLCMGKKEKHWLLKEGKGKEELNCWKVVKDLFEGI